MLRGTAAALVVAVLGLGLSSAATLRGRVAARTAIPAGPPAMATVDSAQRAPADSAIVPQGATTVTPSSVPAAGVPAAGVPAAGAPPNTSPNAVAPPTPNLATKTAAALPAPTIRVGTTELGDGVVATRSDSAVLVAFDTPELRTRTPEKFERFLRLTLAKIYGPPVATALASLPLGRLVAQGNLLYELPTRGIQVPLDAGSHLEIFPEIRPGEDGPLVVRYHVSVVKN